MFDFKDTGQFKKFGANQEDLLEVSCKKIKSILQFVVPVWNSSLTGDNNNQKNFLQVIFGDNYISCNSGLYKQSDRRKNICLIFAEKSLKDRKCSKWFRPKPKHKATYTRQENQSSVVCKEDITGLRTANVFASQNSSTIIALTKNDLCSCSVSVISYK